MTTFLKAPATEYDPQSMKIFLAGSIDQGAAEDWQSAIEGALADCDAVTVFNPRRDDWDATWGEEENDPRLIRQIEWELTHLEVADLVVFYFDPKGSAPITLLELGKFGDSKSLVCCPPGYWRRTNVQVFCKRNGIRMVDDLDDLILAIRGRLGLTTVEDILGRARKTLINDGWVQGQGHGDCGGRCLINAIAHATRLILGEIVVDFYVAAVKQVKSKIPDLDKDTLVSWNDARGRTMEEILAVLS